MSNILNQVNLYIHGLRSLGNNWNDLFTLLDRGTGSPALPRFAQFAHVRYQIQLKKLEAD